MNSGSDDEIGITMFYHTVKIIAICNQELFLPDQTNTLLLQ